jgi:GAF domain-containing protein
LTTASQRLRLLYEVSRRLTTFTDLDELLRYATRRTRELFDAEGCSVLLLDRARDQFYFPIASQSESRKSTEARLADVRFPADRGIAGWVLQHQRPLLVPDVQKDERFYGGVDEMTTMQTRSLLCAPMRSHDGSLGVIEVINPGPDVGEEDLEFLEALASDIAVAHENAALHQKLRGDLGTLRQVCTWGGIVFAVLGVLVGAGTVFGRLASGVPLDELIAQPGAWTALLLMSAGGALAGAARAV